MLGESMYPTFLALCNTKKIKWTKLGQIGSDWTLEWIRVDQIGSDWIRLNHIGSNWINAGQALDQIGSMQVKVAGAKCSVNRCIFKQMIWIIESDWIILDQRSSDLPTQNAR